MAAEGRRGRPRKTLEQRVCEGRFLARQHEQLLASSPRLPWPLLPGLQRRFRVARSPRGRRLVALEFERAVRQLLILEEDDGGPA